ncbi:hypothetical protein KC349_g2989 [Hortaea werneckii]|nr:hypothetical protein KC349_g2989 [Hortaea werneckii]
MSFAPLSFPDKTDSMGWLPMPRRGDGADFYSELNLETIKAIRKDRRYDTVPAQLNKAALINAIREQDQRRGYYVQGSRYRTLQEHIVSSVLIIAFLAGVNLVLDYYGLDFFGHSRYMGITRHFSNVWTIVLPIYMIAQWSWLSWHDCCNCNKQGRECTNLVYYYLCCALEWPAILFGGWNITKGVQRGITGPHRAPDAHRHRRNGGGVKEEGEDSDDDDGHDSDSKGGGRGNCAGASHHKRDGHGGGGRDGKDANNDAGGSGSQQYGRSSGGKSGSTSSARYMTTRSKGEPQLASDQPTEATTLLGSSIEPGDEMQPRSFPLLPRLDTPPTTPPLLEAKPLSQTHSTSPIYGTMSMGDGDEWEVFTRAGINGHELADWKDVVARLLAEEDFGSLQEAAANASATHLRSMVDQILCDYAWLARTVRDQLETFVFAIAESAYLSSTSSTGAEGPHNNAPARYADPAEQLASSQGQIVRKHPTISQALARLSDTGLIFRAARLRPVTVEEKGQPQQAILAVPSRNAIIYDGTEYPFDWVFGSSATNAEVSFLSLALADEILDGHKGLILCNGPSGSGKSYTLLEGDGLMKQAMFRLLGARGRFGQDAQLCCTLIEIYNDVAYDLLNKRRPLKGSPPSVREDVIASPSSIDLVLSHVNQRNLRQTALNATSSRGHILLTLFIRVQGSRRAEVRFLDLAGSERLPTMAVQTALQREAENISSSRSALFQLLRAAERYRGSPNHYIPGSRDTTLNRLVFDSLKGDTKVILLTCLSPLQNSAQLVSQALEEGKTTKWH